MSQVLHNHIPEKLSNHQIRVQLDSESQKKELAEKIQLGLMGFLKEELSNYSIELQIEVAEEIESKNLIYTATDKYKYLAEQNPALESLKKNFSLDFE
jgi:DNA polymerase-3 subunit gamma/tau